jgi:hypothetical protein
MKGNVIQTVASEEWRSAGAHTESVSLEKWPAGAYFVQMTGTNFGQARKLVVAK